MSAAEVLSQHQPWQDGFYCTGCVWTPRNSSVTDAEEFAGHQLDKIKAAGYAVVELPKPSYVDEPEEGLKGFGFNGFHDAHLSERGVYAHDGLVYDQWDGVTPADARKVGGWWLAAADAAEVSDV